MRTGANVPFGRTAAQKAVRPGHGRSRTGQKREGESVPALPSRRERARTRMGGKLSGMTRAAWSGRGDRNGASSGNDDASDAREGVYGVGLLVVREGEVAAVTDTGGRRSMVEGPQSLRPGWGAHVAFLQRTQCDGLNYLRVSFVDGRVQHLRGPASVFVDHVVHKSVTIAPVLKLEGNEAIVVYADLSSSPDGAKESAKGGAGAGSGAGVQRRVVRGPVVFVPSEREWIHEFSWRECGASKSGSCSCFCCRLLACLCRRIFTL